LALKSTKLAGTPDRAELARAVRELLKAPSRPPAADGGDGRTASYPAWLAYAQGHIALRNGDFETAEKYFREAATDDPEFGPARVWLAQVRAWIRPSGRQEWREDVTQGIHAKGGLSEKDGLVALALSNLATKRYPEACASYARIVSADSLNFTGWYGLGQCRALDSLVIPSVSSPSRWRFRSRYSEAASAFMKAVSVNPAAHSILSFDQMQVLLPIASTRTRRGMSASGEEFAAYPALIHDTVFFVPYPLQDFSRLSARQTAAQQSAALSRNLDVLLEFTTQWTRDAPRSAGAYQALADVLEARGEIANVRSADMSAIQAVSKARELAATPHDQLVAATSAGWLLFKQGEFASARILADSILFVSRTVNAQDALTTIGLAALTGKVGKTSELARVTIPYGAGASTLPIPVMDAAAPFFAFASLGVCGDTIKRLEKHLDDQIAHYVAEDDQPQVAATVKARALGMLASCTRAKASLSVPASTRILSMQQALAKGESGTLRRLLGSTAADARAQRPGDIALDFAYQAAWLTAESGDTAGAARQLDRTLGGLPSMSAAAVREPASAAAAGRAMALRAELAAARGETAERQKWARAVVDLWATADAPLQPVVARMRSLAAPNWSR
jgi:tetratricopeptide (TPR) repeat protein